MLNMKVTSSSSATMRTARVAAPVPSCASARRSQVVMRAEPPQAPTPAPDAPQQPPIPATEQPPMQAAPTPIPGTKEADSMSILNTTNEAINGRASMMGFAIAMLAEATTHQGVISQIAGKWENQELVERAVAGSDLGFGAVVALTTVATLMPRLIAGMGVSDKVGPGPFTPGLEKTLGRVAMMGFAGLLIVEDVMGHSLL